MKVSFREELDKRAKLVQDYLQQGEYHRRFVLPHQHDSVYSYVNSGGKCLRPAVLLFSCGAVGGDEDKALPAAVGIEVFHTWTLVHDDIIDRDDKRRGNASVHAEFSRRVKDEFGYEAGEAQHYGLSIAILAGDIQHGWALSLFCELYRKKHINPDTVLYLISELDNKVLNTIVEGEILDIQYSKFPLGALDEKIITDMLWKKTGALYEFAGRAGTMIGLEVSDPAHELVRAISQLVSNCGTAFQLQDDILGLIGDEKMLGKPVGSDIKEGKMTTIVHYSFSQADEEQRESITKVLGNKSTTPEEIERATSLIKDLGGVEHTKKLARSYIEKALSYLELIPESKYKDLLHQWADFMISREF